jgi:triacylglycerol lipase
MNAQQGQIAQAVQAFGHRFDPEVIGAMRRLIAPMHDPQALVQLVCDQDLAYGDHPRQRLDVYNATSTPRPALVFVHGGGFTAGDKRSPDGAPFYQNVGVWAAQHDMVGVAMTYRLAPEHRWPSGAQDIAVAMAYLHTHSKVLGIDPSRIVLMGQSAGAVHVASYLAQPDLHLVAGGGVAAGVLVSGLYDMVLADTNPPKQAYFSNDPALLGQQSSLEGLLDSPVPLMVAINEFDLPDFERQAQCLVSAYLQRHGHWPWFTHLKNHNHISSILALGLRDDALGADLALFLHRHLRWPATDQGERAR